MGFTTEELDELEKGSPSPKGMTLEASPSNKFTTEDLDSMEGKMVSPPSPEGSSTWEGIKSKFKEFSESPTVQEMKYRSGFPQAMEFFGGGKRAVDIAAGALTDPLGTGLVDPRKGNEAGQLVGNLLVKGLNPYEMMTDPIGKTPLQESTHPAARFLQTGVESLGGLATDPNAPFIPGSKVVAAAFAPGMVEQVVSGLEEGTPEGYAEALFGGGMLGLMGKHHLKGRGKKTTSIPQERGINPEADFARAVEEAAAPAPEPFRGTKKEALPGGWSIELNSQGGYDAISPGGMKFKYPTEKAARKGIAQEIQPPPSLKPMDVEALPSIPMKPEPLPGEAALPNIWTGEPIIGEPTPDLVQRPGPGSTTAMAPPPEMMFDPSRIPQPTVGRPQAAPREISPEEIKLTDKIQKAQDAEDIKRIKAEGKPPVELETLFPEGELNPQDVKLMDRIGKEQEKAPNQGRFKEAQKSAGEQEIEEAINREDTKGLRPPLEAPLPIELKATIQEAIESGFNAKTSIKQIQEKLSVSPEAAKELYWKTKRALNAEKRGGHLELEELPFKAENVPENVSTDFKNIYTKNPQVQKLHRFITNIFESVNKTVEGVIPGEERVLENNYAGLMFKPGRNAFRYGAKGNRPEHIGGKTVGDIYVNPWSIAVEARLQENAGKIPKGSAHQYFIDKVAEAIGHEPAHARARHGEAKVKDLFTGEETTDPFNPQKMQEDFSFQTADQSVRNNPEFNRIMEGVKSPQNDAAVKEMYKSILKDAAKVYKETLKGKKEGGGSAMEMKPPPTDKELVNREISKLKGSLKDVTGDLYGEYPSYSPSMKELSTEYAQRETYQGWLQKKEEVVRQLSEVNDQLRDMEGRMDPSQFSSEKYDKLKTKQKDLRDQFDEADTQTQQLKMKSVNEVRLTDKVTKPLNLGPKLKLEEQNMEMKEPPSLGELPEAKPIEKPELFHARGDLDRRTKLDRLKEKPIHVSESAPVPWKNVKVTELEWKTPPKKPIRTTDQQLTWSLARIMKKEGILTGEELRHIQDTGKNLKSVLKEKGYDPVIEYRNAFEINKLERSGVWENARTIAAKRLGIDKTEVDPLQDITHDEWKQAGAPRSFLVLEPKSMLKVKRGIRLKPIPEIKLPTKIPSLKGIGRESERGAVGTGGNKPINPNAPIPPINLGGHSPSSPMGKGLSAAGSTSLLHKTWEAASGVSSSIRAFTVGGDFSSVLRQNWIQTFAHPVQSTKNVKLMVKSMTEKGYDRIADDIRKNPYFKDATDARLGLTKGLIENLPEEYMEGVEILHKGFKKAGLGSVDPFITTERAFSQYSNLTRMDSFARGMNLLEGKYGKGKIPPDVRDMLAKWINTSTGRGNFSPKWESTATNLNKILFSPRLLKARIDTPIDIVRAMYKDPKLGLMAAGELARATAFVGSIVGVIAASTGATVEGDLRSADFGKIRLGNTSIDPWGGFQPYVRLAAQIASGKRKTQYGDIQDVKFGDLLQRFARSKLAPVPGFAWTALEGKDYVGERKPLGEAKTYWDSFGIMTVRDIAEIWKQDPVLATSLTLPIALGIGTTTRPSLPTSKEVNKEYQRLRIAPPMDVESFEDRSKAPLIDRKTGKAKFERRKLSNEEFKSVKGKTDPEVYKEIEKFITSPSYKKLSDADKTIALHKLSRQMGSFRKKRSRELLMQPPPPTSQR